MDFSQPLALPHCQALHLVTRCPRAVLNTCAEMRCMQCLSALRVGTARRLQPHYPSSVSECAPQSSFSGSARRKQSTAYCARNSAHRVCALHICDDAIPNRNWYQSYSNITLSSGGLHWACNQTAAHISIAANLRSSSWLMSGSIIGSSSPSSTDCKLYNVRSIRWSVTRFCGKL